MSSRGRGIRLRATVRTPLSAERLARLPFELEGYVAAEPRLRSVRWLDCEGPDLGARAEICAEIPFTVPLVSRALGAPEVHAVITGWDPSRALSADFSARHFTGEATVRLVPATHGCGVEIGGSVAPRSRAAAVVLKPVTPLLETLSTRAIERGVARAVAYLEGGRGRPPAV